MISQIKKHRVKHGNIMAGIDDLMDGATADFIYSDPPWGQGNLRYWQTINNKMTGAEKEDVIYSDFLEAYFSIISKHAKDKVVLEYGCKWNADIVDAAKRHGFKHHGSTVCYYKSGSKLLPCDLHFLSKTTNHIPLTQKFIDACAVKQDLELVKYVFDYVNAPNDGICLDPMCGMGFTAQAAIDRGMSFYGNELNKARLEKTKARLSK